MLINPDITLAQTLPSSFYTTEEKYLKAKNAVFMPSWQFVTDTDSIKTPGSAYPFMLLEGMLNEPLLLTRDMDDAVHCLSNVCTHRGTLVTEHACSTRNLQCRYHGRRFRLDGKFMGMPEFDDAKNFPSEADNLPKVPFHIWGKLIFASLSPQIPFEEWLAPVKEKVGFLPLNEFIFSAERSRDYLVQANWALYCDNYLEGYHIPFVHPSLNQAIDYGNYRSELFPYCNLQVGIAKSDDHIFDLPTNHPDKGQRIAAYYFWMYPNLMLNFYPWGLSINVVRPLAVNRTRVSFLTYIWRPEFLDIGAGSGLDRVEREDEAVVECVQKGVQSSLYDRGRYSPKREQCVHHFHTLLANAFSQQA